MKSSVAMNIHRNCKATTYEPLLNIDAKILTKGLRTDMSNQKFLLSQIL